MRNELLNELELEDLQGEARDLAETIGMDAFRRLVDVYGGTGRVYIPQADKLLIPIRDRLIRDEYNGDVYKRQGYMLKNAGGTASRKTMCGSCSPRWRKRDTKRSLT